MLEAYNTPDDEGMSKSDVDGDRPDILAVELARVCNGLYIFRAVDIKSPGTDRIYSGLLVCDAESDARYAIKG